MSKEEFMAFPQSRVKQIEEKQQEGKPYSSPHLQKRAAVGMVVNGVPTEMPKAQHAPMHNMVPVQQPGFTAPTSEPESIVLDLPSNFAFYDFKDIYVKPFKGYHLGKLSRAKEEQSTLHMAEVV